MPTLRDILQGGIPGKDLPFGQVDTVPYGNKDVTDYSMIPEDTLKIRQALIDSGGDMEAYANSIHGPGQNTAQWAKLISTPILQPKREAALNILRQMYGGMENVPVNYDPEWKGTSQFPSASGGVQDPGGDILMKSTGYGELQTLAHELEHVRSLSSTPSSTRKTGDEYAKDPAYRAAMELPSLVAQVIAGGLMKEAGIQGTGLTPSDDTITFPSGMQMKLKDILRYAKEKGVLNGKSITELLAENPQWVKATAYPAKEPVQQFPEDARISLSSGE